MFILISISEILYQEKGRQISSKVPHNDNKAVNKSIKFLFDIES